MDYSTYFLSKKEMMVCIGKGILAGMLAAWILYQSVYGMVTVFIFIPLCIQREKRKRQEQELDYISSGQTSDFSESFSDIMTNPEKHILKKDAKARLMQAIQSLPPQYSQAIIMRYYNNMSIEDIAVAMDYSRSTVKRRLRKGRKLLENMLHEEKGGICFE